MDSTDHTDEAESRLLELRVHAIRNRDREILPIGECHWCGEEFGASSPKLFCDAECSLPWERDKENRK